MNNQDEQSNDTTRRDDYSNNRINNDDSLHINTMNSRLDKTNDALLREKTKRRTRAGLTIFITLLIALLAAAAAILVYKAYFEPIQTLAPVVVAPSPKKTVSEIDQQTQKVEEVVSFVRDKFPSTQAINSANPVWNAHRAYDKPFRHFATAPTNQKWQVMSAELTDLPQATTIMRDIHTYFTSTQKATAETLYGDDKAFSIKEPNAFRFTTDDFTCKLLEEGKSTKNTGTYDAAIISLSCAPEYKYREDAKLQQSLYRAAFEAKKDATPESFMITDIKVSDSKTAGYKLAKAYEMPDTKVVGGGAALFYQTPRGEWIYFTTSQSVMPCEKYSTSDLKKAYAGEVCSDKDKQSKVTP